jgi:hypothetical protein
MFGVGVLRGHGDTSSQGRGFGYGIAGLLQACDVDGDTLGFLAYP